MRLNHIGLIAVGIVLALTLTAFAPAVRAEEGEAFVTTDKPDYHPEEIVTIFGYHFLGEWSVNVSVTRPDGNQSWWDATSTGNGSFETYYQLDGIFGLYLVEATDGTHYANTTFTDAPAQIDLDQCRNGPASSPNDCEDLGGGDGWVNGNAGASQSHYVEGYSIPYRAVMTNLPTGTSITVVLGYDIKHSDKHAIDYLTHYQRLEPHLAFGHAAETVYPKDGVSGVSGTTTDWAIPAPSSTSPCASPVSGQPTTSFNSLPASERKMTLFGGTITGMAHVSEGCLTNAQAETQMSVTFTVNSASAVLSWGGHIARALDWGSGNSAGGISGSPYHMRFISWSLSNIGQQDRSLSAAAVLPTGTVVIQKVTVGGDAAFGYTATGSGIDASFSITTSGGGGSKTYSDVPTGTKSVSEYLAGLPIGWSFTSLSCSDPDGGTTTSGATATIDLDSGETVVCTFTNTLSASLTVIKHVISDNGGTLTASDFTVHVKLGGVDVAGSPSAGSEAGTSYSLGAGTYVVSENMPPSGYAQTGFSGDCDSTGSVTLAAGESKTCTITNNDVAPSLTLIKVVTNDNGGTALATAWTLTAAGPTPMSGTTPVTSGATFSAGTYTLSESGPSGYAASSWSCTGTGTQSGNDIALDVGESAVCTITNDDVTAHLTLVKVVVNDNGGTAEATDWMLSATGPTPLSGAGGADGDVDAGTYTLSESAGPTGYAASAWSCVGGSQSGDEITLALAESATCTIKNDDVTAHLTLVKVVVNDNGGTRTAAEWTLAADGPTPLSGTGGADGDVDAGQYDLSESGPTDYTAGSWSCVGGSQSGNVIALALGQSATCTIKNNDIAPSLTLIKYVVNDNGGTAVATNWILYATGPTSISGAGGVTSGPGFSAGTYDLSESTGPTGYASSAWSCVGGSQSGPQIILALAETATCSITNDDTAPYLKLIKYVVNDNGGTAVATDWTLYASGPTPISGTTPVESDGTFDAGTYALSELGPSGYDASDWVCTGTGTQDGAKITLALAQSATCTITNDDIAPKLTLVKIVINDNGGTAVATDWTLSATGPTSISGAGGATSDSTFSAGTYALSESTGPSGYAAGTWSCVGGSQSGDEITLELDQEATCTIKNNDIQPKLIVIKHVVNDNGGNADASDFTIYVSGNNPDPGVFDGEESPGTLVAINAGSYAMSEGGPEGYAPSYSTDCTGSLAVGETKTCTITNDDIAPKLTLVKVVINDNGGTAVATAWTLHADGPTPISGAGGATSDGTFKVGTYNLGESVGPAGYAASAWSCEGGSQVGDAITLALAQTATCTITNNDIAPSLALIKYVVNGNGGSPATAWTLTASGPTPISGSTPVNSGPTFSAGTYTLSESGPSGYDPSAWSCTGGTQSGSQISLGIAESAICEITNTQRGRILVDKMTFPSGETQMFGFVLSGSGLAPPGYTPFELADASTPFDSGLLPVGTYSVTEEPLNGWVLMAAYCSDGSSPGSIQLSPGEVVVCTFKNAKSGFVTDSALCAFDRDANRDGQQFRLILTQDPQSPSTYKVTATNPGQFFFNVLVDGAGTQTVTMTFPYPFVTQGATPIHVYDSVNFVNVGGRQCLVPGTSFYTSTQQVTLASYPGNFGTYASVSITFDSPGFAYVNIHLDYGLKGSVGWSKGLNNEAYGSGPFAGQTIYDLGSYSFSYNVVGDGSGTSTIENENTFKHDPGFAGIVTTTDGTPVADVLVKIYKPDGSVLATLYTDIDGFYFYNYKHQGKPADYTVNLPDYGRSKTVTVKANQLVWVAFTDL